MSGQRCTSAEGRNPCTTPTTPRLDRKSTRLNSSHLVISYAVFCLKKKHTSVPARGIEAGPPKAGAGVTSSQIFVSFVSGKYRIQMTNVINGLTIAQPKPAKTLSVH